MGSTLNSATNPWEYSLKRPHLEIWFFGDWPILVPSNRQKYILWILSIIFFFFFSFQIPVSCTGPLRLYINTLLLAQQQCRLQIELLQKYLRVISSAPLICGLNFEPLCVGKTCCHWYTNVLTIPSACQQTLFFFFFTLLRFFISLCHFDCFSVVSWACPPLQRLVHEDTALLHSTAFLLQDLEGSMLEPFLMEIQCHRDELMDNVP